MIFCMKWEENGLLFIYFLSDDFRSKNDILYTAKMTILFILIKNDWTSDGLTYSQYCYILIVSCWIDRIITRASDVHPALEISVHLICQKRIFYTVFNYFTAARTETDWNRRRVNNSKRSSSAKSWPTHARQVLNIARHVSCSFEMSNAGVSQRDVRKRVNQNADFVAGFAIWRIKVVARQTSRHVKGNPGAVTVIRHRSRARWNRNGRCFFLPTPSKSTYTLYIYLRTSGVFFPAVLVLRVHHIYENESVPLRASSPKYLALIHASCI